MGQRRGHYSNGQVADYWYKLLWSLPPDERNAYPLPMWADFGEADCWACGRYDPNYPDIQEFAKKEGEDTHQWEMRYWSAAKLQQHHILPISRGGPDEPANIVLLCKHCHSEVPHSTDLDIFWNWMRARRHEITERAVAVARRTAEQYNMTDDEIIEALHHWAADEEFREVVYQVAEKFIPMLGLSFEAGWRDHLHAVFEAYKNRDSERPS